ncbi:acyl-CoA dehydrogenase family protein, partial [Streptomyces formicae]
KLCMTSAATGAARAALAIAVRHADRRRIGGFARTRIPISALRSHQDRLTHSMATGYALTFLHRAVTRAWAQHTPESRAAAERQAAVAKAWITWQARDIVMECRERCGAQGLLASSALANYTADIEGTITAEGDNLAITVKSAADLIFDTDPAPLATRQLAKHTPTTQPATPLEDLHALRDALAAEETRLRRRAATDLRSGSPRNPLARWNSATPAALELTTAHAQRLAADAFLAAVDAATEEHRPTGLLLHELCRLFLLQCLAPRTGDLLTAGTWNTDTVRRLPPVRDALLAALGPQLPLLTDAFSLPDHIADQIPASCHT